MLFHTKLEKAIENVQVYSKKGTQSRQYQILLY